MTTERNFYLEDIPLDEANARLEAVLRSVGRWDCVPGEMVPLTEALGRITAEPVWARLSSPHYHASAMDGYAVQANELHGATETRPLRLIIGAQAFPVNTGDPLPPGTNTVIMIEDTQPVGEDAIDIRAAVVPWQHVRLVGEDMVATEVVLPANHRISPVDLGAAAGCGHHLLNVRRQPLVIIIPTGNELIPPTQAPSPGQIIEYNSLVLRAQVIEAGGTAEITLIIPDDPANLQQAMRQAIRSRPDLILILSGSSAGSRDFTAAAIRDMGQLLVHGVAVRPGHPVIIGMVEDTPVIGVPGYPVSAALTGELFVQPLIAHWLGIPSALDSRPRIQAIMTRKVLSPIGDDEYVRVTLAQVEDRLLATPLARGAGVITSLVKADGLAHLPRFSEGVDMGQPVDVILYRALHEIQQTIASVGSHDPLLDLLGQHLTMRCPGWRLISANVGSIGGLIALRRKEAHLAGTHLLDPHTGDYNIPYLDQYLPDEPLRVITFAHREQGFMVAPGNPLTVLSFDDLPRVRFVNRQRGAGTRLLLDYELKKRDIDPTRINGYEREEYTHLAVASAVASGAVDCGLGVRSAAIALNLDFVSVSWERYDLVIPTAFDKLAGIQRLHDILQSSEFQQLLSSQAGYDSRETGKTQFLRQ